MAVTSGDAYLVGRNIATEIAAKEGGEDLLYAAIRSDGITFNKMEFKHCTFANVSFKDSKFLQVSFTNCTFISCYFRDTLLQNCHFSGCNFIGSDLSKVDVRSCDFRYYNTFHNCFIKYRKLRESLPGEGNLKSHLCNNLAREAKRAGFKYDEGLYRQDAAEAREKHLAAAVLGSTDWFKEHYKGSDRVIAAYKLAISRFRGYAWGYSRSWLVVLRNWAFLALVVFPLLFLLLDSGVRRAGKPISAGDAWVASLGNMLPGSGISNVEFVSTITLLIAFIEVLVGLLFAALVAALLFASVFERDR